MQTSMTTAYQRVVAIAEYANVNAHIPWVEMEPPACQVLGQTGGLVSHHPYAAVYSACRTPPLHFCHDSCNASVIKS
jgi:hypothetical protein